MKKLLVVLGAIALSTGVALAEDTKNEVPMTVATATFDGTVPLIPKGYRLAWTDDRLNPLRGVGTPEGEASMRLIWTDDVPAVLVEN